MRPAHANNKGQIVGYSRTGQVAKEGFREPPHHAVLWALRRGT
jgi:hypothetical protein